MQSVFGLVKWAVIIVSLLFWLLVSLANQGEKGVFKLVPNSLEWQSFPISSIILFAVASAYIIFFIVGLIENVEHLLDTRILKKRISDLENELRHLRNEPIREGSSTDRILAEERG
jgi:hypothetical protein